MIQRDLMKCRLKIQSTRGGPINAALISLNRLNCPASTPMKNWPLQYMLPTWQVIFAASIARLYILYGERDRNGWPGKVSETYEDFLESCTRFALQLEDKN